MIRQETLTIDALLPGMRLAAAVVDASGQVLLPVGSELTEGMLQSLVRRGVSELLIATEFADDPAIVEARRVALERQMARLFRKAGNGVETMVLYQAILDFRLERAE